jgi:hypothetical protein
MMRHRKGRNLYIRGTSREDTAEHAQQYHHNPSPPFERTKAEVNEAELDGKQLIRIGRDV